MAESVVIEIVGDGSILACGELLSRKNNDNASFTMERAAGGDYVSVRGTFMKPRDFIEFDILATGEQVELRSKGRLRGQDVLSLSVPDDVATKRKYAATSINRGLGITVGFLLGLWAVVVYRIRRDKLRSSLRRATLIAFVGVPAVGLGTVAIAGILAGLVADDVLARAGVRALVGLPLLVGAMLIFEWFIDRDTVVHVLLSLTARCIPAEAIGAALAGTTPLAAAIVAGIQCSDSTSPEHPPAAPHPGATSREHHPPRADTPPHAL